MKNLLKICPILKTLTATVLLVTISSPISNCLAQGTAFTYQGQLLNNGSPVNGAIYLKFALYGAATGGSPVNGGGPIAPNGGAQVTLNNNGLFTVTLDFGSSPNPFAGGPALWLEIDQSATLGGSYTAVGARQGLTATPYAIFAGNASGVANAVISAPQLNTPSGPSSGQVLSYNGSSLFWTTLNSGVLTLPYSGAASSSGPLFSLNNTGSGPAATFLAGNVGIGAADPTAILDVRPIAFANNQSGGIQLACTDGNYASGMFLRTDSAGIPRLAFDIASSEILNINNNAGNVGIGTTYPTAKLDVRPITFANNQSGGIQLACTDGNYASGMFLRTDVNGYPRLAFDMDSTERLMIQDDGSVGIGTGLAQAKLDVRPIAYANNQSGGIQLASTDDHWRSGMFLRTDVNGYGRLALDFDSTETISVVDGGFVGINNAYPQSALDVHGETRTCVLTITGGCDLAEPFHMSQPGVQEGSVVIIDDANPGQLELSSRAYDNRVAGIVSGANGINPGIRLTQQGVNEGGQNVALTGRAYALADASSGAIKPGDLLTTSDTPGHCMKVTDVARAQGAIIGKAMSSLTEGKGLVLVLVSLQ